MGFTCGVWGGWLMKMTIEYTEMRTQFRDREYSVWTGFTAGGHPVLVLVNSMRCTDAAHQRDYQIERQLTTTLREISSVNTMNTEQLEGWCTTEGHTPAKVGE